MNEMLEADLKIKDEFLSLNDEQKKEYLNEHKIVILDIEKDVDGFVRYTMEMRDEYAEIMESHRHEGETLDDCISRIVTEQIQKFILANELKEVNGNS